MADNLFDHIAYATSNTDKTLEILSILGFSKKLFYKEIIDRFGVYISKVQSIGGQVLEVVEPISERSVVSNILLTKNASIYHSAFFTPNLENMIAQLKKAGAVVVTEPMDIPYPISKAHTQYKASHVFHPQVGLFEVTGPAT